MYAPWKDLPPKGPVGRQCGGVGTDHATGMLKSDADILFPIGEGENHQAVEVVNFSEQEVIDCVEWVNAQSTR